MTALAATYATGTVRVLYRPWAKATLCHLTTHCVYSSPFPPSPSSSFLSFRSSHIAQSYEFRRRPLLSVKCILLYLVGPSQLFPPLFFSICFVLFIYFNLSLLYLNKINNLKIGKVNFYLFQRE